MLIFIFVLIFLDCILLTAVVLVQESKGGGLATGFSSANQMMGVKKTTEFLERATWTLAIVLMALCLAAAYVQGGANKTLDLDNVEESGVQQLIQDDPTQVPQSLQQQPAPNQGGQPQQQPEE